MNIVEWIYKAREERWALGQFNMSNLETLQGIVDAGNRARSPLLVGVSMGTLRHVGLDYLPGLVQGAKAASQVPLFFHLDHGDSFEAVQNAIAAGFDSIMIDASRLPLSENIDLVRQVVEYGHARGIGVEAQIGETWDEETGDFVETRTKPSEIPDYVAATGVDYLAISFGNTPGRVDGQSEEIDVALIAACVDASPVPIVLHGGTSIPDQFMQAGIALGASKVNIDTAIRRAATKVLHDRFVADEHESDPRKVYAAIRRAVTPVVIEKMQLFGSTGRA